MIVILFIYLFTISCNEGDEYINDNVVVIDNETETTKIVTSERIGERIFPSKGAQGLAIYGDYLFRLYQYGYCYVYDISDISNIFLVNTFKLGSYATNTHPNCAQFAPTPPLADTGFPLLYVTLGNSKEQMAIEKVSLDGSECLKRVIVNDTDGRPSLNTTRSNWIIGDDGYIWGMSNSGMPGEPNYTIHFYKLILPESEEKIQTLNIADAIDHFTDDDYENLPGTWQGGMVRNGKLYFLFGTTRVKRELRIYDTMTHERLAIVDLQKITTAEPEDIDVWQDNKIIIGLNTVDYALLLQFVEKTN